MTFFETKSFRTSHAPVAGAPLSLNAWLPALFGVLVICCESTRTMGADHTAVWLQRLCSPIVDVAQLDLAALNHLLRKNGHFFGYGALAVCFARGWMALLLARLHHSWTRLRLGAGLLGIVSAAVVASLDEIHQSFLSNRGASAWDVLLDTCGALLLVALTTAIVVARRRRLAGASTPAQPPQRWLSHTLQA